MTNSQALLNMTVAAMIMESLLAAIVGEEAAAELISGGEVTITPAGLVGDLKSVKDTYDANPDVFVDTQQNVDDLDDVVDGIVAIEIGDFSVASGEAYDALQAASPEA